MRRASNPCTQVSSSSQVRRTRHQCFTRYVFLYFILYYVRSSYACNGYTKSVRFSAPYFRGVLGFRDTYIENSIAFAEHFVFYEITFFQYRVFEANIPQPRCVFVTHETILHTCICDHGKRSVVEIYYCTILQCYAICLQTNSNVCVSVLSVFKRRRR